jgi:hypothetical protein
MAKRRKKTTTTRRRKYSSRRYSGVGSVSVNETLGALAGAGLSRVIVNALGSQFPKLVSSAQNKAVAQVVLGLVTKPVSSAIGIKSPMVDAFGKGMILGGGYELLKVISPKYMGATDESDVIVISGADEIAELNGMDEIGAMDEIAELNGMDEIGQMDETYDF